tara:strand:+ start:112 stop:471 length:360 start_codon:yes stop_codon:yes gene_type:complete
MKEISITNKFLTMNNCKRCDKEGIVSACCLKEIKFISNGAAKCSECKKFCKIDYCPDCKEKKSAYIIPNEKTYEESLSHKEKQLKGKEQEALIVANKYYEIIFVIAIVVYIILYIIAYN